MLSETISGKSFKERIYSLMDLEISKRDNFFFEMCIVFGDKFEQLYHEEFATYLDCLNKNATFASVLLTDTKRVINMKNAYKKACQDIRNFIEFMSECLKVFIQTMSVRALNDNSLIPTNRNLKKLSTKVIFGKNKVYQTLFNLVRINNREEENRIKKFFE